MGGDALGEGLGDMELSYWHWGKGMGVSNCVIIRVI